jgi:hypothetical protein
MSMLGDSMLGDSLLGATSDAQLATWAYLEGT